MRPGTAFGTATGGSDGDPTGGGGDPAGGVTSNGPEMAGEPAGGMARTATFSSGTVDRTAPVWNRNGGGLSVQHRVASVL